MERLYIGIAVIFIFGLGIIFLVRAEVKVGTGTMFIVFYKWPARAIA